MEIINTENLNAQIKRSRGRPRKEKTEKKEVIIDITEIKKNIGRPKKYESDHTLSRSEYYKLNPISLANKLRRVLCPECNRDLSRNSLNNHMKLKHLKNNS